MVTKNPHGAEARRLRRHADTTFQIHELLLTAALWALVILVLGYVAFQALQAVQ